ncbi:hypothetical protein Tco_0799264 [Tanacetum coccineum]
MESGSYWLDKVRISIWRDVRTLPIEEAYTTKYSIHPGADTMLCGFRLTNRMAEHGFMDVDTKGKSDVSFRMGCCGCNCTLVSGNEWDLFPCGNVAFVIVRFLSYEATIIIGAVSTPCDIVLFSWLLKSMELGIGYFHERISGSGLAVQRKLYANFVILGLKIIPPEGIYTLKFLRSLPTEWGYVMLWSGGTTHCDLDKYESKKKVLSENWKKIIINGGDTVGYDKKKNSSKKNSVICRKNILSNAMLAIDVGTGFDWSYIADEEVSTNFALD